MQPLLFYFTLIPSDFMSSMLFNPFWKTVLYCDSMIITGAFTLYGIRGRFALGECILLRDERCWVFLCWLGMMQKQLFESWDNQVTWMSLIWKHYLLLDLNKSMHTSKAIKIYKCLKVVFIYLLLHFSGGTLQGRTRVRPGLPQKHLEPWSSIQQDNWAVQWGHTDLQSSWPMHSYFASLLPTKPVNKYIKINTIN